jgi:hypothetical protein
MSVCLGVMVWPKALGRNQMREYELDLRTFGPNQLRKRSSHAAERLGPAVPVQLRIKIGGFLRRLRPVSCAKRYRLPTATMLNPNVKFAGAVPLATARRFRRPVNPMEPVVETSFGCGRLSPVCRFLQRWTSELNQATLACSCGEAM